MNFKKAIHIKISPKRTVIMLLLYTISMALGFFLGSRRNTASLNLVDSTVQKAASGSQLASYSPTEFPEKGAAAVYLHGIDNVEVRIGQRNFSLISALSSGKLSTEDIAAQAFLDAKQGLCNRTEISRSGLSRYRFAYPGFDLCITRDVFESAFGGRYPIFSLEFFLSGEGVSSELEQYLYTEDGETVDTRAKDWGLQFSIEEVSPDGIVLNASQKGGQQSGSLTITRYSIYDWAEGRRTERNLVCTIEEEEALQQETPIPTNTESKISLDWEKLYGTLPSGEYELHLFLTDENGDSQRYVVPFSITPSK